MRFKTASLNQNSQHIGWQKYHFIAAYKYLNFSNKSQNHSLALTTSLLLFLPCHQKWRTPINTCSDVTCNGIHAIAILITELLLKVINQQSYEESTLRVSKASLKPLSTFATFVPLTVSLLTASFRI